MNFTTWIYLTQDFSVGYEELCLSAFLCLLHAGFLLSLFFDAQVGGDMFLRNVG
jgi:hypothetical protein